MRRSGVIAGKDFDRFLQACQTFIRFVLVNLLKSKGIAKSEEAGVERLIKGRFLLRWVRVRKEERARVLAMTLLFFLLMMTFWALKPMKRGLFISYHREHALQLFGTQLGGAQAEQVAKVANVFAALLLAVFLTSLLRRLAPRHILLLSCSLFVIALLAFASLIRSPGALTVWSFYVFGDMYSMLMLTLFWTLMSDWVEASEAKRVYSVVGLGGVMGGMAGATLIGVGLTTFGRETVLLLCVALTVLIAAISFLYTRCMQPERRDKPSAPPDDGFVAPSGLASDVPSLGGWRLLASSKYLLGIAGLVIFYEVASSIVDFQLSATVERHVADGLERDRYFGFIGQIQGAAAILVQVFLTGYVMRRFGIGAALLALPLAILFGSIGFLLLPTLSFATLMSVSDNGMSNSINQSAKEALFVPITAEEKYQAKAFIDILVQRFAKTGAAGFNLVLVGYFGTEQVHWLSFASILVLVLWIGVIRFAGRRFDQLARGREARFGETKFRHTRRNQRNCTSLLRIPERGRSQWALR